MHELPAQQRADARQDRAGGLRLHSGGQRVVPVPKPAQSPGFVDVGDVGGAEFFFRQQRGEVFQGGAGHAQQGEQAVAQDVVGARAPVPFEDAAADAHEVVHDQVAVVAGEGVEAGRVGLGGVDDDHAVGCGVRVEPVEDVVYEVAFGVDDHRAAFVAHVGQHHVGDQGGFADAGGADDVDVVAGVGGRQRDLAAAGGGCAQGFGVAASRGDFGGRGHDAGAGAAQLRHGLVDGHVRQGGQFVEAGQFPGAAGQAPCGHGRAGDSAAPRAGGSGEHAHRRGESVGACAHPLCVAFRPRRFGVHAGGVAHGDVEHDRLGAREARA